MKQKIFSQFIFLNGKLYNIKTSKLFNLKDLLSFFSFNPNLIVLEYNGKICSPKNWSLIKLKFKDKIETITIVGGG